MSFESTPNSFDKSEPKTIGKEQLMRLLTDGGLNMGILRYKGKISEVDKQNPEVQNEVIRIYKDILSSESLRRNEQLYNELAAFFIEEFPNVIVPSQETSTEEEKNKYHETAVANGIEISVTFNGLLNCYEIYFPQIDLNIMSSLGVDDQTIVVSGESKIAKHIFELAVKKAGEVKDVYELYKEMKESVKNLS